MTTTYYDNVWMSLIIVQGSSAGIGIFYIFMIDLTFRLKLIPVITLTIKLIHINIIIE